MRKQRRPIDALFSKTRLAILGSLFRQPERWWFLSELADDLRTTPSSLQRELESLASSGLLERRRDGRRTYYRPNAQASIFAELRALVDKTVGISEAVRLALEPHSRRIRVAFLYGSVASAEERAESDVDVMVIGAASLSELSPELRNLERRLRREVNATTFRPTEFRQKARSGHHFVKSVLEGHKRFVIGNERELADIIG